MQDGPRYLTESDLNTISLTKDTQYGALGQTADGRFYRYASFSGTSTVNPGLLMVAAAAPANSTGLAITAVGTGGQLTSNLQAGSTQLVITNGATAVTQDEFGFLEIIVSAGGSYKLKLRGNTAAAANTGYITVYLQEPLPANTTQLIPGTDTVNLRVNPYKLVGASLTKAQPIGVTVTSVPLTSANSPYYGWVQTLGPAFVAATTATKGQVISQDLAGTAGFVKSYAGTTDNIVGVAQESAASSTTRFLQRT